MKVTVQLYATLGKYLPSGTRRNEVERTVSDGTTLHALMSEFNLPLEVCKLVLVNGIFVPPAERDTRTLAEGDTLSVWPPVAGG